MYKALKDAKIPCEYEKHTFELLPSFTFKNDCIERQANSKGDFINRLKGGLMMLSPCVGKCLKSG